MVICLCLITVLVLNNFVSDNKLAYNAVWCNDIKYFVLHVNTECCNILPTLFLRHSQMLSLYF